MTMQPTLWSVNALATECGMDRRTVARRLADVPPAGERAGHPVWRLADALPALVVSRRPAGGAGASMRFALDDDLPDIDLDVTGEALMEVAYRVPAAVAGVAVGAGAPCRIAYAVARAMSLAAVQLVAEVARTYGLRPWADEDDPPVIDPDGFEPVNWPRLAERAGEPLDLDAWQRWTAECFADPEDGTSCDL